MELIILTKLNKEDWNEELDWPSNDEWDDMIGPKWVYGVEFYMDEGDEEGTFQLRSWSVPQPILEGLAKIISEIKEDCYLIGTYEDEVMTQSVHSFTQKIMMILKI